MDVEYVYVLKLEEGKFYVGKSKDVDARLRYHRKGANARAWTAKYKPVPGDDAIYYQEVMKHNTYEDAMTEKVMFDFGIENVRGGTYSQEKLPPHQVQTLEDKKCTWEDRCFVCMKKGHMSRFCPNRRAFEASPGPGRREGAATSTVDELTKGVRNLRVKPTCGENGMPKMLLALQ
jgi:predicted GIY-YIG superfamily endonuclease